MKPYYEDDYVTLYCGDNADVLPQLISNGFRADVTITDPPYSNQTHDGARSHTKSKHISPKTGKHTTVKLIEFASITPETLIATLDQIGAITRRWAISFMDWQHAAHVNNWATSPSAPLKFIRHGIWHKDGYTPQFTGDRPATGWESIVMLHQKQWKGMMQWNGGGKSSVYKGSRTMSAKETFHPTQKPLWLMQQLVTDFSNPNEVILDPYAGGGSTGIAAKILRRRAVLIERDATYCAIAAKRLRETQPMMELVTHPTLETVEMSL